MTENAWLAIAILTFGAVVVVAQLWRSVKLKVGFSSTTMRMHVLLAAIPVIGALCASAAISSDAAVALLGAAIGFAVGTKVGPTDKGSE